MSVTPSTGWVGIGLRDPYHAEFLEPGRDPAVDWLEVHAENYFERGGPRYRALGEIADRYPISIHGVALSLGSAEGIDTDHLERLCALAADIGACRVSEHLAWSRRGGVYFNDLLPFPLSCEALDIVSRNIDRVQRHLGRSILIENPSSYLDLPGSVMSEGVFLARLVERTGCGLLVDVNNLFISSCNLVRDTEVWLDQIPVDAIGEVHLAGHEPDAGGSGLLIDAHGCAVAEPVWALYEALVSRIGPRPTIVERDCNWPSLDTLLDEAARAARINTVRENA
ncbi:MAG: hypothetical protein BVN33_17085 [Proteobacteria bacterium ST_bin13]|nr:MAG: hypothetical protein BVN33_17085 [Proteobacteria bacterium ST_bin13]